jgi:hypothetical protein
VKFFATGILAAASMCLVTPGATEAADRKTRQLVAGFTKDQVTLLARLPALVAIDTAIRGDCAAKNAGQSASGAFCGCASAVTMGLWRSGMDPKMMPRLADYLANPTEKGAKSFLLYQGPELYRPLCTEAVPGGPRRRGAEG